MVRITDLANELIGLIADFVPPPFHLPFALACSKFYNALQHLLNYHRECHIHNAVCSDIQPSSIPKLIRAVLEGDEVAIWHIRSLEFWGDRSGWDDWKPLQFISKEDIPADAEARVRREPRSRSSAAGPYNWGFFSRDEIDGIRMLMRKVLLLDEEDCIKYAYGIDKGNDAALKGLLIPLCPRLKLVRFMRWFAAKGANSISNGNICLMFLAECLATIRKKLGPFDEDSSSKWPPGFLSLQRVAVGVKSKAWTCRKGTEMKAWTVVACQVLGFLTLPKIEALYLKSLTSDGREFDPRTKVWIGQQQGFSTLRELFLDTPKQIDVGLTSFMVKAAKCLEHLTIQGGYIYGFDTEPISGDVSQSLLYYRPSLLFEPHPVAHANNGAHNAADDVADDTADDAADGGDEPASTRVVAPVRTCFSIGFCRLIENDAARAAAAFDNVFRDEPLRALVMVGDMNEAGAAALDHAIATFIENYGTSRGLTAFYLEGIDHSQRWGTRWWQESMAAGKRRGVEVHTRTTKAPRNHSVDMPWPVTDRDLECSPFYGHESLENMFIKPHLGLVENDCGNCLTCRDCRRFLPPRFYMSQDQEISVGMKRRRKAKTI